MEQMFEVLKKIGDSFRDQKIKWQLYGDEKAAIIYGGKAKKAEI